VGEKARSNISSRNQLTAPPWVGNDVEKEYAQMISDIVKKKTQTLSKLGFEKYAENNLIIYVNQMLPILESSEATTLCRAKLCSYWKKDTFDNVYVEYSTEIHHYSQGGVEILPLNDLWK